MNRRHTRTIEGLSVLREYVVITHINEYVLRVALSDLLLFSITGSRDLMTDKFPATCYHLLRSNIKLYA